MNKKLNHTRRILGLFAAWTAPLAIVCWTVLPSDASIVDFGIFGHRSVGVGNGLNSGAGASTSVAVGSNGGVTVGNDGDIVSVVGGGTLSLGNNEEIFGAVLFHGNVTFGGNAHVHGDIDSGGNVSFAGTVEGSIRAKGNVTSSNNSTVKGDVHAGGNTSFGNNSTVIGTVHYGGTHSPGNNFINPGGVSPGTQLDPATFAQIDVPDGSTFTATGANVGTGANGSHLSLSNSPNNEYGAVSFGNDSSLTLLTPGSYYFSSFNVGKAFDLLFGDPTGLYSIFIATNFAAGNELDIKGIAATNVFIEILGNFTAGNDAGHTAPLGGTIFAPDGNITFGNKANIAGALYAGNQNNDGVGGIVTLGNNAKFTYAQANNLPGGFLPGTPGDGVEGGVPEPMALIVWSLLIGSAGLAAARRRDSADEVA